MVQSSTPVITSVLTAPGLGDPAEPQAGFLSIGLVIDGRHLFWGECPIGDAAVSRPLSLQDGLQTIDQHLRPFLQGRPLASLQELCAEVDALTEQATIIERLPLPERPPGPKFSRRAFFTGRLETVAEEPPTRTRRVTRLIHPALRHGVSQALLAAMASARQMPVAQLVADTYEQPLDAAKLPLHAEVSAIDVKTAVAYGVKSLGYTTPGVDHKEELGENAEWLQRFARRLTAKLVQSPAAYQPAIHLNVQGGLGALYDHDTGRILGSLYGLEQSVAPYRLRVEEPLLLDERPAQLAKLAELKELLRLRKMEAQVVAGRGVETLEDVHAHLQAVAVHMIGLDVAQLGTLHQTIAAILACRQAGVDVLLRFGEGSSEAAVRLGVQVALAARPALLGVSGRRQIALVVDEIGRFSSARHL